MTGTMQDMIFHALENKGTEQVAHFCAPIISPGKLALC
ncbi:hypothetical protein AB434_1187 [Heyndrickxia coagulans]|uniref:Uncharacterized protein n=1 Tax=Heyndrickxia coagulans TaxID=1398 RepID=A0AAN0TAP0_HEYCO|nr:hypothetical protein SB48_HM08orf06613 [Heyndrickxia coagulans]AKN53592.1 hypothetical protein AB434_1187 [Heyndrickxia coagulans]KYC66240.1 hypothetical protein B4100_1355 [Heyndrickxia coagulans]